MDGAGATPVPSTTPPRWGISDAAIAWFVSLVAAALALAPFITNGELLPRDEALATFVGLVFQTGAAVGMLAFVALRKGRGSLTADFGLRLRLADSGWLAAGFGLAIVSVAMVQPILELGGLEERSQDVVRIFDEASGLEAGLLAFGVLLIAPIGEELLFRGALLRSLQRRLPAERAIFVSALIFAVVHVLLDPGSGFAVPALLLLGLISAWRAVETRSLSQSIYLHAGFNLLAAIGLLFDLEP
ncbi:MAG: CPBP family intramembrane glutamic endopeptidase [Acidimicrobiia bacterium]